MGQRVGFLAMALAPFCLVFIVALLIQYLRTLQKAVYGVARHNRLMAPGLVWLSLIPVFGLIWSFFIATRIPNSFRNEFRERGDDDGSDYGKRIGLGYATLRAVSFLVYIMAWMSNRPEFLGTVWLLLGLTAVVLFILFCSKIAGYSSRLAVLPDY